jgi:protein-S-isoprenylcysteine O-methyltransferase Ste14
MEIVQLDDLPTRFANSLESAATRVRALTSDRLENLIRTVTILVVLLVLISVALAFFLIAAYRALSTWLGAGGSMGVLGGLFLLAGLLIWNMGRTWTKGSD